MRGDRAPTWMVVVLCVAAAATGTAVALRSAAQARRVSFRAEDALGRTVDLGRWRGRRIVLVTFTSSDAKAPTRRLLQAVDEELPDEPALETVLVADMRPYDNVLMRGFAQSELESSQRDAWAHRRARRQRRGGPVSSAQVRRFSVVPDWGGAILRAFGVSGVERQPITFVVDGRGVAHGPIVGSSASARRRIIEAIVAARATVGTS